MVGVENLFGFRNIHFHARGFRPRQNRKPFDVIARHRIVRCHRRHARKPAQFFQSLFLDLIRHAGVFNLLPQLLRIASAFILLTQFFLDGLHLLAQVVLTLGLLHAILNL